MAAKYSLYREVVNYFKKNFPTKYSVSVLRVRYKTVDGMCTRYYDPNRYVIRVNNKLDEGHAIDVFLHEYSHAIFDSEGGDIESHCHRWGGIYSKLYRALEAKFKMGRDGFRIEDIKERKG